MARVFRKVSVRPIPASATVEVDENGRSTATWKPRGTRRAITVEVVTVNGRQVIRQESSTWFVEYRDASGRVRVEPTGCETREGALHRLAEIKRQVERVHSGVLTRAELATVDHLNAPIQRQIEDYSATLTGRHATQTRRYLERLTKALAWRSLSDLQRDDLELWLSNEARPNRKGVPTRSARSRNAFQTAVVAFANWLVEVKRLTLNPFAGMTKAKIEADRRHLRRSLTPDELNRLILAAQNAPERPALKHGEENGRRPAERMTGRERGILYAFLAATGLRVGEAQALRIADLDLDGDRPVVHLSGSITKNGKGGSIPLRSELVEALRTHVQGKRPREAVFSIPADLLRRFYGDLRRAGIEKDDERGRTLDLHCLRVTFGTSLARAGVPLTTAQRLMRHSDPKLTANVYVDARLLDLHGAVESLPSVAASVAVSVAGTPGNQGVRLSLSGTGERSADVA